MVPGFDPDLVAGFATVIGDAAERTARRDALGPLTVAQARARLADLVR